MKRTIKYSKKKHIDIFILLFLVSWIPRVVLALNAIPIKNVSDDVALLSTAAFFAGDNWNSVVSNAGYYGFGFYGLFFWLFRMKLDAVTIFKVIVFVVSIMQALSAPICMWIMYHEFHITNLRYCFGVAVFVSYLVVNRVCTVSNEHPINLLVWIVIWILCHIINKLNQKERTYGGILLIFLLIYSLTIHTRNIVLCIAIILGLSIYMLVYKSRMFLSIKMLPVGICACGMYFLVQKLITVVQQNLWIVEGNEKLRNASYSVSIQEGLSITDIIKSAYFIIIGQLNAVNFFTLGVAAFLLCMIGNFLLENIRKRSGTKEEKCLFGIAVILLLSIGAMIFAQSLSWLSGVAEGIKSDNYADVYSFKAFSYLRYFMPFIGPLAMVGMIICYYKKDKIRGCLHGAYYLSYILIIQWLTFILPKLKNNPEGFTTALSGLGFVKDYADVSETNYYLMIHFFVLAIFLFSFFIIKKRYKILFLGLIGVMVYQYYFCAYYSDYLISKKNTEMVNAGYKTLTQIQSSENITLPVLYVYDASQKNDHQNFYMYQFYFPYSQIIPELPKDEITDVIIISNQEIKEKLGKEYFSKRLDENEYIYLGEGKYSDLVKKYIED